MSANAMALSRSRPQGRAQVTALVALGAAGLAIAAVGPWLHQATGGLTLFVLFAAGSGIAYFASLSAESSPRRQALTLILLFAAAMRLALLVQDPTLSTDIYRYIWDGRVQADGINPYRFVPRAPELSHLRDTVIWPHINRADYAVTIYPPTAQMIFLAVTRLGESVLIMKLGMLAFEAMTIVATLALLHGLGLPLSRIVLYAWQPLAVWEIAGNGHVDAAMISLLMVSILLFVGGRTLLAGVAATAAALVKPTALLVLPVLWRPWDWRLPAVFIATVALLYLPYLSVGWGVLGFLPGYVQEEDLSTGSGFRLMFLPAWIFGSQDLALKVYLGCAALVLIGLALAAAFRRDRGEESSLRALRWLLVAFLVLSSPHYPWYFLVLAPFAALSPSAAVAVLLSASVLLYDVIPQDPTVPSHDVRTHLFTLLTVAAIAYDIWRERPKSLPLPAGERP